jgi:DNA-binding response OmpR family regulator
MGGRVLESNIMIVCDEASTSRIWALLLAELQCTPVIVNSIAQAVASLEETAPDLIVVDVKSREISGVEICKALREHVTTPILLLTPINNESHTLETYQAGADECVIKPISPELFLAKIKVWLRRGWTVPVESLDKLMIGKLTLEPTKHQLIRRDGKRVRLSNLEFRVLYLLMKNPNQAFSSDEIIKRVWGFDADGNSALVKNVIYRLRKKIEPNMNEPRYICTEEDGYIFKR